MLLLTFGAGLWASPRLFPVVDPVASPVVTPPVIFKTPENTPEVVSEYVPDEEYIIHSCYVSSEEDAWQEVFHLNKVLAANSTKSLLAVTEKTFETKCRQEARVELQITRESLDKRKVHVTNTRVKGSEVEDYLTAWKTPQYDR